MKRVNLIIGAGASKDLYPHFGLGSDLIDQVAKSVTTNRDLLHYFSTQKSIDFGILQTFQNNLNNYRNESKFKSIDEFLTEVEIFPEFTDWKNEYLLIGKLSILYHIVGWEAHYKNNFEVENIKHTWVQKIVDFLDAENILEHYFSNKTVHSHLNILTFNYDRSLEYSLKEYYLKFKPEYSDALEKWMNNYIIHVYDDLNLSDLEFGHANNNLIPLVKYIDRIKIAYDKRGFQLTKEVKLQNTPETVGAEYFKSCIEEEPLVGSIGFGFDYFNCRNINLTKRTKFTLANIITIDKTGSFENRRTLTNHVRNILQNVEFKYGSCKDFLTDFFKREESY